MMQVNSFLKQHSFKSIRLNLTSKGDYSYRDSEWNYSDIPHLDYIHSKVDSFSLEINEDFIGNIFIQQIGPLSLPAMVFIQHRDVNSHEYLMSILNILIYVNTTHVNTGLNKATTNTEYQFFFRGLVGRAVAYLARYATKKNYSILMSEDMPMRLQRGSLRSKGIKFMKDKSLEKIGFRSTLDLTYKNVNGTDCKDINTQFNYSFISSAHSQTVFDQKHQLFIKLNKEEILIYPAICQHEGASLLDIDCQLLTKKCPWHGLRITPLVKIKNGSLQKIRFQCYHVNFVAVVTSNGNASELAIYTERTQS